MTTGFTSKYKHSLRMTILSIHVSWWYIRFEGNRSKGPIISKNEIVLYLAHMIGHCVVHMLNIRLFRFSLSDSCLRCKAGIFITLYNNREIFSETSSILA